MKQWCVSLRFVKDAAERESAYKGFCSVLPVSIKAVTDNFPFLCSAISCYKQPPADLEQQFANILTEFKQFVESQPPNSGIPGWEQYAQTFPASLR